MADHGVSHSMKNLVSIILPAKNSSEFITESIRSILSQTHKEFELLICDDHSSDNTVQLIETFDDKRINLFKNKGNGLVDALNLLIAEAKGEFVCRMDADDTALPSRIESQINFIRNTNFQCIGSSAFVIDSFGNRKKRVLKRPTDANLVGAYLFHGVPIIHPTAFGYTKFFKKYGYRNFFAAEDYDLWVRAWLDGAKIGNSPDKLLNYRIHGKQVSKLERKKQARASSVIRASIFDKNVDPVRWSFSLSIFNIKNSFVKTYFFQTTFHTKLFTFAKIIIRELKCIL